MFNIMKKSYDNNELQMEVKKYENWNKMKKEEMDKKYTKDMSCLILSKVNKKKLPDLWQGDV